MKITIFTDNDSMIDLYWRISINGKTPWCGNRVPSLTYLALSKIGASFTIKHLRKELKL